MNEDNDNSEDMIMFPGRNLYLRNNLDNVEMDVENDQDDDQNEENEIEYEEDDYEDVI